jgi:predicted phosphodiesterase
LDVEHEEMISLTTFVVKSDPRLDLRLPSGHAGMKPGDVIAFGHTHTPWHREVGGIHFVNTGSVGRPKDGDWRAGYVLLDVGGGPVTVEFVRVEYDVDQAMQAIRESDLPGEFAEYLRTGGRPTTAPTPA